jgi:hypothetical protein
MCAPVNNHSTPSPTRICSGTILQKHCSQKHIDYIHDPYDPKELFLTKPVPSPCQRLIRHAIVCAVGCPQPGDHHPADYIQRHKHCPSGSRNCRRPKASAPGGPHGAWLVHYEIGGQQLTDYWFYVRHRWVFDLVLSNPDAVKLYRMSPSRTPRRLAVTTDQPTKKVRQGRGWLGGRAAGHELAAGVLVQSVEEPVGDGQGVVVGFAGQGEAADQHVQACGGGGVVAFVG